MVILRPPHTHALLYTKGTWNFEFCKRLVTKIETLERRPLLRKRISFAPDLEDVHSGQFVLCVPSLSVFIIL